MCVLLAPISNRRWREKAKQYKFKGHAAAIDSLFGDIDFSDFSNSAAPPQPVASKKEASEKAEDRFWKAYLQHVKRVHVGQHVSACEQRIPEIQLLSDDEDEDDMMMVMRRRRRRKRFSAAAFSTFDRCFPLGFRVWGF